MTGSIEVDAKNITIWQNCQIRPSAGFFRQNDDFLVFAHLMKRNAQAWGVNPWLA